MNIRIKNSPPPRHKTILLRVALVASCLGFAATAAIAATPLFSFDFNESDPASVKDSVNNLSGSIRNTPPTSIADTPSGAAGDRALQFNTGDDSAGENILIDDPDVKVQLDPSDPSFTVQAWVKFDGNPAGRQVLFFNNGPGGAISFSVNTDRTVFVTTLGILDVSSQAAIPDDGQWHHIAVVHENGVELRFYVDGVLGDTVPYTQGVIFTRTETSFSIGSESNGGLAYIGALDRLKLTSGALTPDQFDSSKTPVAVVDSDNDGIPDSWEIANGLNPNDASDAAKDCNGNGLTNLQEYQMGLSPCDTTVPTVVSAATTSTFDTVNVTFSKSLDPASATNIANYSFSPALTVKAASYKNKVVTLTTAAQTPGATKYTVTVTGVKDLELFQVPASGNQASFYSYLTTQTGVLKFSYWGNITGTTVDLLQADPRYPATPDLVGAVSSFNSRDFFPDDSHENYGATMEGYLTPTESGSYDFFLRSDDSSQLWISTDDTPAFLVMVAEEPGCCNAFQEPGASQTTAAPIALVAGKKYFVQCIYKEGGGGDYAQVAWRKVGDTTPAASLTPIPGSFLSSVQAVPVPSEGTFITSSPAANAKDVNPTPTISISHRDGATAWLSNNVSLKLDGVAVASTFTKVANVASLSYKVPSLLPSASTHTVTLGYLDAGGQPATQEWTFTVFAYSGPTKDTVSGNPGLIVGKAAFTADAGGHSGKAGDYAIDLGKTGGAWVDIKDVGFINSAATNDTLSMSFWLKRYDVSAGSAFWAQLLAAPKTGTDLRGFQAHVPWSDDNIYFDTAGCCDGALQRVSDNIANFADYSVVGTDDWWNTWHQFVFTKKAEVKNIYIDGSLFLSGVSSDPLPTDFGELALGSDGLPGADFTHGVIDDFAVFSSEISAADAAKLASGTSPKSLTGENLVAYWDFNDVSAAPSNIKISSISAAGGNITITWSGGGTLQSASAILGPWTDVTGKTSPATVPSSGQVGFFRIKQ